MPPARSLLVLYGSQTGCAADVADQVCAAAVRRHLAPRCLPMDEYDVRLLPTERIVIFVTSTAGEGEVPDNMRAFWRFLLRNDLPMDSLSALRHATFGLGDSRYPKYNFAAKRLHRRLEQLGSTELVPLGMGDDQDDIGADRALVPWLCALNAALSARFPIPDGLAPIPADACPAARYEVVIGMEGNALPADDTTQAHYSGGDSGTHPLPDGSPSRQRPWLAPVLRHMPLTAQGSIRRVRHLELCLRGSNIHYVPGDSLAVSPCNDVTRCRQLLAALGIEPATRLRLRRVLAHAPAISHAVETTTALELFVTRLDLFSVPRRSFFALLAHFADDCMQQQRLREFGAIEGERSQASSRRLYYSLSPHTSSLRPSPNPWPQAPPSCTSMRRGHGAQSPKCCSTLIRAGHRSAATSTLCPCCASASSRSHPRPRCTPRYADHLA